MSTRTAAHTSAHTSTVQDLVVVPVTAERLPLVSILAREIWNLYYPSILPRAQIDYLLGRRYSGEALAERLARPGSIMLMAQLGPMAVGFACLSVPEDAPDEVNLDAFYLHPDHHRRGYGTRFMELVVQHLGDQPRSTLVLNVNRLNITAINFYFRIGFTIRSAVDVDQGRGFIGNDYIMERVLGSA
jgi:ribosomal protein S18 acetylase RimI-like enzyme